MAKISELLSAAAVDGTEILPMVQKGSTRRVTLTSLLGSIATMLQANWYKGDPGGNISAVGLFTALGTLTIPAGTSQIDTTGYSQLGIGPARLIADATATAALAAAHPRICKQSLDGRYWRIQGTRITPEQAGCIPATETNAGQIVTDIARYLRVVCGGGVIVLSPATVYQVTVLPAQTVGGTYVHGGNQNHILLPPGVAIEGNGATIKAMTNSGGCICARGEVLFSGAVTGPIAAGTQVFQMATVADAANYAVRDWVLWRLGDIPYDTPETFNWGWARVKAVDTTAGTVTIDRPLARGWDGTGANNKHLHKCLPVTGTVLIGDVNFEPLSDTAGNQAGLVITHAVGPRAGRVRGRGQWAGSFITQYVEGFHIDYVEATDNPYTTPNQGQGCRFAESTGYIGHLVTRNQAQQGIATEATCEIDVGFHEDFHYASAGGVTHVSALANGDSRIHIERANYAGNFQGQYTLSAQNGSSVTFGSMRFVGPNSPYTLPLPGDNVARLSLRINDVEELYIGARGRWWERLIEITDGMAGNAYGYPGCVAKAIMLPIGNVVRADLSSLYIGRYGGSKDLIASMPVTASTTEIDISVAAYNAAGGWGEVAGSNSWLIRANGTQVSVNTPAGTALNGAGKALRVRMLIVPNELAPLNGISTVDAIGERAQHVYEASAASTMTADIAAGATVTQTIAVTGLAAGDFTDVSFSGSLAVGLAVKREAVGNGVKVSLTNVTAAAIVGGFAGTIYAQGRKRRLAA